MGWQLIDDRCGGGGAGKEVGGGSDRRQGEPDGLVPDIEGEE
jgi:hypothetical protein